MPTSLTFWKVRLSICYPVLVKPKLLFLRFKIMIKLDHLQNLITILFERPTLYFFSKK